MFTLILILLLLFLPGVILPMALKTLFTSNELNEMGVSMEDPQPIPVTRMNPVSTGHQSLHLINPGLP